MMSHEAAEAHFNLCLALKQMDRLAEAEAGCSLQRAQELAPDPAERHDWVQKASSVP